MNFLGGESSTFQYVVPALIAALVSIAVVFLSRRSETKKHLESLRTAAYLDFIRGVAGYGSNSIVSAMALFLRAGNVLDTPQRAKEFTAICQKMRSDTRPRPGEVSDYDAHFLLFGLTIDQSRLTAAVTQLC